MGSGNTNVSTAINNFVNSVPNGTSNNPSIIVFPAGKTYQLMNSFYLTDLNKITLWGYGSTFRLTGHGNSSNLRLLGLNDQMILKYLALE